MYDISMTIKEDMLVYKGKDELRPELKVVRDYSDGDAHESELKMNVHTGTHIDAPLHMLEEGEKSNIFLQKNPFYNAQVLDLSEIEEKITAADLQKHQLKNNIFLILKTKNSKKDYLEKTPEKFIYLAKSGAKYLLDKNIIGIGIDSNGIERNQAEHPTHKNLLKNKVIILEGLRLNDVPAGDYVLLLSLLKVADSDGLPARAHLFKKDEIKEILKSYN